MPKPTIAEIALHKPGDAIQEPEGTYTVNPDGVTTNFQAKPTKDTSPPNVTLPTEGTDLQKLQQQRDALEARYNDPSTPAEEKTNILTQLDHLSTQIRGDAPRPTVVGPRSTLIGPDGQPIYQGTGVTTASPGSAIVGPDGKIMGQVPVSPTAATTAAASATSAQAALINAKVNELQQQVAAGTLQKDQAKDQFDEWYKVNVELPNTQATTNIAAQSVAQKSAEDAQSAAIQQARFDQYNQPGNLQTIHDLFASRGLAAPSVDSLKMNLPGGQNLDSIATAATMKALQGISPTANAIYGSGAAPTAGSPMVPGMPGASPADNTLRSGVTPAAVTPQTPVSDAVLAAAQAAAAKPYQTPAKPYQPTDLLALGL